MDSKQLIIQNAITQLSYQINACALSAQERTAVLERVRCVDTVLLERLCSQSSRTLTTTNLLYIICFLAGLETQVIASIFAIEVATVYSVRYRLRAYFTSSVIQPF